MAAPNIVNVTNILGRTVGAALTNVSSDIVVNPANSNKVFKINTLIVANIDGVNNADVTIGIFDASANTTYRLALLVTVPADASLDVLAKPIYLEEGDKIVALASANSRLEIVASFEEIA